MFTKRERNILSVNPETPFPSSVHKLEIISISQKADGDFLLRVCKEILREGFPTEEDRSMLGPDWDLHVSFPLVNWGDTPLWKHQERCQLKEEVG